MAQSHERLRRPLEIRTSTRWEGMVTPLKVTVGKSTETHDTTAYTWLLKSKGMLGIIGGVITVIPEQGIIAFWDKSEDEDKRTFHEDPEDVLRILNTYGWEEPPNFDKIVESLNNFRQMTKSGIHPTSALAIIAEEWRNIEHPGAEVDERTKKLLNFLNF